MRRSRPPLGIVGQGAAGAGVGRRGVAVRRGQRLRDFGARAEAGIGQPELTKFLQRSPIFVRPLRLDQNRLVPLDPEPAEVLIDAIDEFGLAARLVEIFDTQPELSAGLARSGMANGGAVGVPEMQPT